MNYEALGNTAISEDSPAGQDVAYEPEFEELQQEIDKLSSVTTGAGQVDWNKVERLSVAILAEKSKHLLVGVYLAKALMQTRQLDGLIEGTQVLKDMIAGFWDNLYPPPKRKKGRINALQWWLDQADSFFRQFSPSPLPEEKITTVKDLAGELDALVEEKLGDDAPVFRPLLQHIDRLPVAGPEKEPVPEATLEEQPSQAQPPSAASQPVASNTSSESPEGVESEKDANRVLKTIFSQMSLVAAYYREKDPANPLGYRLNRLIAWLTVDELPLKQDDGNTLLPSPDGAIRSGIENQLATGNYEAAIAGAEAQVRQSLFWFDLSRFTAQALEALGPKYAAAHEIVCAETALFVKRLPGVENFNFSDGTPFADNETRAWLKTISQPDTDEKFSMVDSENGELEARIREIETEAKSLLKQKEKAEAVALLQTHMTSACSSRERFLFRMALVRLFMGMGKNRLAAPHIDEILSGIDHYVLETWDPDLAVQGFSLAHENALAEKNKEKGEDLLSRIAKINPVSAFRMTGKM